MTNVAPSPSSGQRDASEVGATSALRQRCGVISHAVGLPSGDDAHALVSALLAAVRKGGLRDRQAIYLLHQAFLARTPLLTEVLDFVKYLPDEDSERILQRFVELPEFQSGPQSQTWFRTIPADALAVDVSQTLQYPHNSGIQRVVRSLAKQFHHQDLNHVFLQFDPDLGIYRLLNSQETQLVLNWESRPRPTQPQLPVKRRSAVSAAVRRVVGERLGESLRCFFRAWREHGRSRRKAKTATLRNCQHGRQEAVFLWRNRILLPELAADKERLDALRSLLTHAPLDSSLVIYDLIPLHSPEFFDKGSVEGFVRYLSLVRQVDRVSCISQAVEQDVATLLAMGMPHSHTPQLATHYLGADFDFDAEPSVPETEQPLPLVLSVGTIEVRKNHWRMLRGMVQAQQRGCRFRGVFAGNPGWLNESFMAELAHHQAKGVQVELRQSVSEAELSQLYRQASFTLYCSLAEGFGLPIVESVAKGVPCITSNRGCMQEVAEQMGGCLLIDPESETQIADAIVALVQNRQKYESLRQQCRHASWLTWSEYARNLYGFATSDLSNASASAQRAA